MDFNTISNILTGQPWLINTAWARTQLPLVLEAIRSNKVLSDATAYKQRAEKIPQQLYEAKKQVQFKALADVYSVTPFTNTDRLTNNSIAMVDVIGPMMKYGDYCTYGSVEYNQLLIRLFNSNRVAGIILNIDCPGGQVEGTSVFAKTIKNVTSKKPVIAIVQGGIMASAAYWFGSACNEIYLSEKTDAVGSIGAYATIYDFREWFKDNGINVIEIYAPQSADKNESFRKALDGDVSLIEADLKFVVSEFISTVKTNRGARLNTKDENPFTGKMYKATEAKSLGLIDGIKSIEDVVARVESLAKLYN